MRESQWPQKLADLDERLSDDVDTFIGCASYESRCLSVAAALGQGRIQRAFIARFGSDPLVLQNHHVLTERFEGTVDDVILDPSDPLRTEDACLRLARSADGAKRLLIDITTFTHESLLVLVNCLTAVLGEHVPCDFVYSTAVEYSVGDPAPAKWLSKGVREVRSVVGYPGRPLPSRATHLILLAGFEDLRAYRIIEELEPSFVSIGYGDRSEKGTGPHQSTNEHNVRRLCSLRADAEVFEFSCYDPRITARTLAEIEDRRGGMNVVVAPMNTKVSTLGAAIYARLRPNVQLCYVQPALYNYERYSRAGDECYLYYSEDVRIPLPAAD